LTTFSRGRIFVRHVAALLEDWRRASSETTQLNWTSS